MTRLTPQEIRDEFAFTNYSDDCAEEDACRKGFDKAMEFYESERLKHKAEIQALEKEVKDLRFENGVLKKIADLYHDQTNP